MNVSIVIPIFNPDRNILKKLIQAVKKQKFKGKIEILEIEENMGFAKQINLGIKKSKYDIVVELPQDCVPANEYWLKNLVEPFKNKNVIASVSKIRLPDFIWKNLNIFAKAANIKEKGVITSLLDGKGGAYRKSILKSVNYFDEKTFKTGGEDLDIYMKIKEKGLIAYPKAEILHYHPTTYIKRLKKTRQYANGGGAIFRIYGLKMRGWHSFLIKAVPIFGIVATIFSFPFNKKETKLFPVYILSSFPDHFYYLFGFWKGFLMGRQTV